MQNCFHRLNNEEKRWRNLYFQRLIVSFLLSIPTSMSVAISQSILVLVGKTFEYLIFEFFFFCQNRKVSGSNYPIPKISPAAKKI
jgi:hypothetical protein